jgi:hypothetical protein
VYQTDVSDFLDAAIPDWQLVMLSVFDKYDSFPARLLIRAGEFVYDTCYDRRGAVVMKSKYAAMRQPATPPHQDPKPGPVKRPPHGTS